MAFVVDIGYPPPRHPLRITLLGIRISFYHRHGYIFPSMYPPRLLCLPPSFPRSRGHSKHRAVGDAEKAVTLREPAESCPLLPPFLDSFINIRAPSEASRRRDNRTIAARFDWRFIAARSRRVFFTDNKFLLFSKLVRQISLVACEKYPRHRTNILNQAAQVGERILMVATIFPNVD